MNEANSNTAAKSESTSICDEPAKYNREEQGEKRAAENNGADNVKRVKKEKISYANVKSPVLELNNKMNGDRYECTGEDPYTMQVTIGDQVFKAEGSSKKTAKILVAKKALQYLSESNDNAKRVKDKVEAGVRDAVGALNDIISEMQYECIGQDGPLHCATYTMQVTIGDQVFKAEGPTKKKAKILVAQAALQYLSEGNVNVSKEALCTSAQVSPINILRQLRSQCKYEWLEDLNEGDQHYVRMKVTVDGEEFEGKGRTTHLAKCYASMYALQKLFNLKFTVPEFDGMPMFDGDEHEWQKCLPHKDAILLEERKHIQEMHKIYRPLDYKIIEAEAPNQEDVKFKCTLKIENAVFSSTGPSRQTAKSIACKNALEYLKEQGLLEQRRAEQRQRLAALRLERKTVPAQKAQLK